MNPATDNESTTKIVFHYSSVKFDSFDENRCDGFWFTDIKPTNSELLDEIGADGLNYCAKCEITYSKEMKNRKNHNVFEAMDKEGCDVMINKYDGFIDYAVRNIEQIKILEWVAVNLSDEVDEESDGE